MDRIRRFIVFPLLCLMLMGAIPMRSAAQSELLTVEVPQGYFLIVSDETQLRVWEGFTGDDGVHRQVQAQLATTDYAPLFRADLASQIYCDWFDYTTKQGWSLQYEGEPYDWMNCNGDGTGGSQTTTNGQARRDTATYGNPLAFGPGEAVIGAVITLDGYGEFYGCYIDNAPAGGTVVDGVVNPWPGEIGPYCDLNNPGGGQQAVPSSDQSTGVQPTPFEESRFEVGATFVAAYVQLDSGLVAENCYEDAAPEGGTAYGGAFNPYDGDISSHPACIYSWPSDGSSGGGNTPDGGSDTVNGLERRAGEEVRFGAGEAVVGETIILDGGYQSDGACYTTSVPDNGTVYGGVVNYWPGEESGKPVCQWVPVNGEPGGNPTPPPTSGGQDTVNGQERRAGEEVSFGAGEAVVGATITLSDGRTDNDCYVDSAPTGGTVYGGVVNPWNEEVAGKRACTFSDQAEPTPEPTAVPTQEPTAPAVGACEPDENGIIRTNTSPEDTCSFAPGATVTGAYIQLGASGYENCTIEGAPEGGQVYGGFIGYMEGSMLSACPISTPPTEEVEDETEEQAPEVQAASTEVATEPPAAPTEEPAAQPTTEVIETQVATEAPQVETTPEVIPTEVPQEQGAAETSNTEVVEAETPADVQVTVEDPPVETVPVEEPPIEQQAAPVEETVVEQAPEEPVIEEVVPQEVQQTEVVEEPAPVEVATETVVEDPQPADNVDSTQGGADAATEEGGQ